MDLFQNAYNFPQAQFMPNAAYMSPRFASLQNPMQVGTPKGHSSRKLQYAAL